MVSDLLYSWPHEKVIHFMTTEITTTQQLIGLAAAGAAALGMSLSEGLLQPMGKLAAIRTLPPRPGTAPREPRRSASAAAPTPEQAAELERQRALYSRPAPGRELEACKIRIPEDAE